MACAHCASYIGLTANDQCFPCDNNCYIEDEFTCPLIFAIKIGDFAVMEQLKAHFNYRHPFTQCTVLHAAMTIVCKDRRLQTTALLMDGGADPLAVNGMDHSPFTVAVRSGYLSVVELFLSSGRASGDSPVKQSVEYDGITVTRVLPLATSPEMVKLLICKGGANVNHREESGITAIDIACLRRQTSLVPVLSAAGAKRDNIVQDTLVDGAFNVFYDHGKSQGRVTPFLGAWLEKTATMNPLMLTAFTLSSEFVHLMPPNSPMTVQALEMLAPLNQTEAVGKTIREVERYAQRWAPSRHNFYKNQQFKTTVCMFLWCARSYAKVFVPPEIACYVIQFL